MCCLVCLCGVLFSVFVWCAVWCVCVGKCGVVFLRVEVLCCCVVLCAFVVCCVFVVLCVVVV